MFNAVFPFYKLGTIECSIAGKKYTLEIDVCNHGVRFKTQAVLRVELLEGVYEKTRTVYFGEGLWLALPNIEDTVLEILNGTEEEVEEISQKYDDLLLCSFAELLTGNLMTGFVKEEYKRLNERIV